MRTLISLCLVLLSGFPSVYAGPETDGEEVFQTFCAMCHLPASPLEPSIGPSLKGVVGRQIARLPGFFYTSAFKKQQGVWTDLALSEFLSAPMKKVPGTAMAFGGLSNADERLSLIAYLKKLQ